tara:strand:+ start:253 stop:1047 length:795 start_codon:yes stop_codon:yes gene_type:complete
VAICFGLFYALLLAAGMALFNDVDFGPGIGDLAPPINLSDHRDDAFSLNDLRGSTVIVTFLYSRCTDRCPLDLANIKRVVGELDNELPITVAVVTVDPDRDTVENLYPYTKNWPDNWHYISGDKSLLKRVWSDYGIVVQGETLPVPGGVSISAQSVDDDYRVFHTNRLFVISQSGNISAIMRDLWHVDELRFAIDGVLDGVQTYDRDNMFRAYEQLIQRCGELFADKPAVFLILIIMAMMPILVIPWLIMRATSFPISENDGGV